MSGAEHSDSTPLVSGATAGSARLSIYMMVAVVLMVSDHRSSYLDRVRSTLGLAVYPLLQLVDLVNLVRQDLPKAGPLVGAGTGTGQSGQFTVNRSNQSQGVGHKFHAMICSATLNMDLVASIAVMFAS